MLSVSGYLDTKDGQYCITMFRFVDSLRMFSFTVDVSPSELDGMIATLQALRAQQEEVKHDTEKLA